MLKYTIANLNVVANVSLINNVNEYEWIKMEIGVEVEADY